VLNGQIGTNLALAEVALDIAPWRNWQVHPPYPIMGFPIKAGMAPHELYLCYRRCNQ
jgi:hypothetical protein